MVAVQLVEQPETPTTAALETKSERNKKGRGRNGSLSIYDWPGHPGKKRGVARIGDRRVYFTGANKTEVRERYDTARAAYQAGVKPTGNRITVGQYFTDWLPSRRARGDLAPKSLRNYAGLIRLHILPALGDEKLKTLTRGMVQHFLDGKAAEGKSPETIKNIKKVLALVLEDAVADNLLAANPARNTKLPNRRPREDVLTILTPDELWRLWGDRRDKTRGRVGYLEQSALVGPGEPTAPYAILLRLLISSGMRVGEATGLRWSDIDWERRRLHIRQQVQRVDGVWYVTPLKTGPSYRTVGQLPDDVWESLELLRPSRHLTYPNAPDAAKDVVFVTRGGYPLDSKNLRVMWRRWLKQAGIERPLRIHDLRGTHATYLLYAGWPLIRVAKRIGHSGLATLEQRYVGRLDEADGADASPAAIAEVVPLLIAIAEE